MAIAANEAGLEFALASAREALAFARSGLPAAQRSDAEAYTEGRQARAAADLRERICYLEDVISGLSQLSAIAEYGNLLAELSRRRATYDADEERVIALQAERDKAMALGPSIAFDERKKTAAAAYYRAAAERTQQSESIQNIRTRLDEIEGKYPNLAFS